MASFVKLILSIVGRIVFLTPMTLTELKGGLGPREGTSDYESTAPNGNASTITIRTWLLLRAVIFQYLDQVVAVFGEGSLERGLTGTVGDCAISSLVQQE